MGSLMTHEIPNATALLQLEVARFSEVLLGAVTERRDFHHQLATTYERASTTTVFPAFRLGDFAGCAVMITSLAVLAQRHLRKAGRRLETFWEFQDQC